MDETLLSGARQGDAEAFSSLTEPYRRELQVHCYRLLGSVADAEDLVQETLLAAWRGIDRFASRSSVRTWLYRIATNRCLNALRDRGHRPTPATPPADHLPEPSRLDDVPWLEPYPDTAMEFDAPVPGPEARVESREAVSLAFVAAVQTMPPRQRAVLILRDVLGYRGAEVADMLDTTEDAVAGALKRARGALAMREPAGDPPLPNSLAERRVIDMFVAAFERCDVPAMVKLLTDDAWMSMPPLPQQYQGRDAIGSFFTDIAFAHGTRRFRLIPTHANGQPAFGRYARDPRAGVAHAHGITVLTLAGDRITRMTAFLGADLLPRFGLPRILPD
ncbi:sigma-70 family RNA polymerase sigma factor [Kutzneria sp. NPDC051319]|uniref:sigma-70 family RNA polymerase sigma factor n=1 Tax=Kutzneria sp. NPDC051319 TaxID=3155047 RepID=UPI003427269C